jgi:hypothetical protein
MKNKTNRWLDVQIVIATLALTFSLALWNLFAGGSRSTNSGTASNPQGVVFSSSAPQPQSRIYLGGTAPQSPSIFNAPAPVTSTGSSRP